MSPLVVPYGAWSPRPLPPSYPPADLLIHCDSNPPTDVYGRPLSLLNDASMAAFPKFGEGAIRVPNNGDWGDPGQTLQVDVPGLEPGALDFTIDLWFYALALPGYPDIYADNFFIKTDGTYITLRAYVYSSHWTHPNPLAFQAYFSDGTSQSLYCTDLRPYPNRWHHLAITRAGSVVSIFLDGRMSETTGDFGDRTIRADDSRLWRFGGSTSQRASLRGYIDEIRVITGAAAWTEDFTPPGEPYAH